MNDKEFNKTKRRIMSLVKEWRDNTGLNWWTINHEFYRWPIADAEHAAAICEVSWEYQRATISWNCLGLSEYSDKDLELLVIHELCHILVNEMRFCKSGKQFDISREEHVVTGLSWAFWWTKQEYKK